MYICMYVCTYVRTYVCMYACRCVCAVKSERHRIFTISTKNQRF